MKIVSITEARRRLDTVLDAAQSGPVVIRRGGDDLGVVVSMTDYERLRAGDVKAFLDIRNEIAAQAAAGGLSVEVLARLLDERDR